MIDITRHILTASRFHMNWDKDPAMIESMVKDTLRQELAQKLVTDFMTREKDSFHTEYRIQVVAMPVKEFSRVINEVALQHRMYWRDPL